MNKPSKSLLSINALGLSVLLALLFSFLFVHQRAGVSVPIFVAALIGSTLGLKYVKLGKKSFNRFDLLYIPFFLLSLSFAWHQTESLLVLNAMLMIVSYLPITYFSIYRDVYKRFSYVNAGLSYIQAIVDGITGSMSFLKGLFSVTQEKKVNNERSRSVIIAVFAGCLVSIPLLLIFTLLFTLADDAFREVLKKADIHVSSDYVIVTVLITSVLLATFVALFFGNLARLVIHQEYKENREKGFQAIVSSVVLTSLNILFGMFVIVQFVYYYGDHDRVVKLGLTYSEYARKGFWELQIVSMLALAFIYVFKRFTVAKSRNAKIVVKSLLTFFTLNVLLVVYSAHSRMMLYEKGYGYTHLRLYTQVFMYYEVALFAFLLVSIWYRKIFRHFSLYSFVVGLVFLIVLNLLNPDYLIARQNIERYKDGKNLDVQYILELSPDAYLQLKDQDFETKPLYKCELIRKNRELVRNTNSWREFNVSNYRAKKELKKITDGMNGKDCSNVVNDAVIEFLDKYSETIESGDFKKAQSMWIDEDSISAIDFIPSSFKLIDYDYNFDNGFVFEDQGYYSDFNRYVTADAKLTYSNNRISRSCKLDYLTLTIDNDAIKISNSTALPLYSSKYDKEYAKNILSDLSGFTNECSSNYLSF